MGIARSWQNTQRFLMIVGVDSRSRARYIKCMSQLSAHSSWAITIATCISPNVAIIHEPYIDFLNRSIIVYNNSDSIINMSYSLSNFCPFNIL